MSKGSISKKKKSDAWKRHNEKWERRRRRINAYHIITSKFCGENKLAQCSPPTDRCYGFRHLDEQATSGKEKEMIISGKQIHTSINLWCIEPIWMTPKKICALEPSVPYKGTVVPVLFLTEHQAMKVNWGSWGTSPLILWPRWVVSFTPWPLYPQGKAPGTHWIRGWVGLRAVLDAVVKRQIPSPRRESNPRTPIVQPVAQRYTDWAKRLFVGRIML
jgi:hypothetical protein